MAKCNNNISTICISYLMLYQIFRHVLTVPFKSNFIINFLYLNNFKVETATCRRTLHNKLAVANNV